jgi:polysaccharide pyruvyl transferase WcaK-like protein
VCRISNNYRISSIFCWVKQTGKKIIEKLDKSKDISMKQHAVIIAGEWHSPNLGDEIICNTFTYLFQDYSSNQNYKLVPLPISIHKMNLWEKIVYYILRVLYKKIAERYTHIIRRKNVIHEMRELVSKYYIQKLIFAGGAVFQEYFVKPVYAIIIECSRSNIPVFFNACGYGPNSKKSVSLFKIILSQPCVKQITTRDNVSDITTQNVMVIPDIAILAYRCYGLRDSTDEDIAIGINIISPLLYIECSPDKISYNMFNNKMIELITQINKKYKITLFTNGNILDYKYAKRLYNQISKLENITIENRPTNGFDLVKTINKFSLIIGFRLHSLIIAYSYNIPAIGIIWDNKLSYWGNMTENERIYMLSNFPIEHIEDICDEAIRKGINNNKKTILEHQILEQLKTYL